MSSFQVQRIYKTEETKNCQWLNGFFCRLPGDVSCQAGLCSSLFILYKMMIVKCVGVYVFTAALPLPFVCVFHLVMEMKAPTNAQIKHRILLFLNVLLFGMNIHTVILHSLLSTVR